MYRPAAAVRRSRPVAAKPSCVYPGICQNPTTNHEPLIRIYRRAARAARGIKKILIGSGLRYDLAVKSPEYVKELVQHHVGGYLKIAPEHTEQGPLSKMMKPGIGTYDRFQAAVRAVQRRGGQEAVPDPVLHRRAPGTTDEDMMNLALWLKRNGFRADQVQALPKPDGHRDRDVPQRHQHAEGVHRDERGEKVETVRASGAGACKAFLRYHDPNNWPMLREALKAMGRADLIGNGKQHLIPTFQPLTDGGYQSARRSNSTPAGNRRCRRTPAGEPRAGKQGGQGHSCRDPGIQRQPPGARPDPEPAHRPAAAPGSRLAHQSRARKGQNGSR